MSTPASCRRRPGPAVDEDELSRFRAWLVARGYADRTGQLWASHIRGAYARGIGSPDEVDAVLGSTLRHSTRCGFRAALREWIAFRGGR